MKSKVLEVLKVRFSKRGSQSEILKARFSKQGSLSEVLNEVLKVLKARFSQRREVLKPVQVILHQQSIDFNTSSGVIGGGISVKSIKSGSKTSVSSPKFVGNCFVVLSFFSKSWKQENFFFY
jgi:hypothetical protein